MEANNSKGIRADRSLVYNAFYQLARAITRFPLLSPAFQAIYLLIALLLPLFYTECRYSDFLLFYLFAAFSLIPASISLLMGNKKANYDTPSQSWYANWLKRSAAHPEVERSMSGAFVFILFLGSFFSVVGMEIAIIICVPISILMEWYLVQKAK